jgi:hypothetical protein
VEPLKFGWAGLRRFMEPHWYLWGLGVEPSEGLHSVDQALFVGVAHQAVQKEQEALPEIPGVRGRPAVRVLVVEGQSLLVRPLA